MSGLPWYKRNPRDAIEGKMGLSLEEKAVYDIVLDLIYMRGDPIPDDAAWIASWCGCSVRILNKARAALIVKGKLFPLDFNGVPSLMNRRAAEELAEREKVSAARADAGEQGGRAKAANRNKNNDISVAHASDMPPTESGNCQPDRREEREESSGANAPSNDARADAKSDFPPKAFDRWYGAYPHKIGKSQALKAFEAVRKQRRATFAELMGGLERYIRSKPPDRSWCNPATWLNGDRWADEPAPTLTLLNGHATATEPPPTARQANIQRAFAGAKLALDRGRRTDGDS